MMNIPAESNHVNWLAGVIVIDRKWVVIIPIKKLKLIKMR